MQRGALHIALRLVLVFFVSLLPNIEFTPFPTHPEAAAAPPPAAEEAANENADQQQQQNEAGEDTIPLGQQAPVQDAARQIQEEVRA